MCNTVKPVLVDTRGTPPNSGIRKAGFGGRKGSSTLVKSTVVFETNWSTIRDDFTHWVYYGPWNTINFCLRF